MSNVVELKATARERVGKGAARATRRAGLIPAVIYGNKQSPTAIAIDRKELTRLLGTGHFLTTLFAIDVDGTKTRVLPRDVQFDPVRDFPVHVDFLRLGEHTRLDVAVPVHFINEEASPGIKRGGVLNIVRHEVELSCLADMIPDHLVADLTGLDIGDSLHISAISLPEGVTPTITDRDFTVATVAAPAGLKSEEAEEGDEAEIEGEAEGDEEDED
ncbi:MAG TPA: 50S ribosomal protein L25/general stress protein Ctc [Hyphomicrobiales bacterium]|nr:50S ribosomal protein L25/general stress protein Ctc [Rhodobiaceae bacterium]HXK53514.1 50S ribosomal protein L25/general stress protein Ctc [Hyphomicrobiales bacterium]